MPPKARVKAKAKPKALPKAKAKGKAKAKPKAGPRRRGGVGARRRGGLRRPSAGGPPPDVEVGAEVGDFDSGKLLESSKVSGLVWTAGTFVAFEGSYWQSPCQVAGYVDQLVVEGDNKEVSLDLRGTTSERLLKWSTGHRLHRLRVHLCDPRCPSEKVGDDYFHGHLVKKIAEMVCLEDGKPDDLKDLRAELGVPAPGGQPQRLVKGAAVPAATEVERRRKRKRKRRRNWRPRRC